MPDQCEEVKRIVKETNLYDTLKEELYGHFFAANYLFFNNIKREYQREYYEKLRHLFADLDNDETFTYKYFNAKQRKFVDNITNDRYLLSAFKNIRRSIFQIRWNKDARLIKIAGKVLYKK